MKFPTIGSVRTAVKTMEMTQKWQQRKDEIGPGGLSKKNTIKASGIFSEKEQAALSMIEQYKKQVADQAKSGALSAIGAKMKSGQDLSPAELDYLKTNAPDLYEKYKKIQKEREKYKEELEKCRTKEDVRKLNAMKMNQFMNEAKGVMSSSMPEDAKLAAMEDIQMRMTYIGNDHAKFVASEAYERLPENREELEEEREGEEERETVDDEELKENMERLKEALQRVTDKIKEEMEKAAQANQERIDALVDAQNGATASDAENGETAQDSNTNNNSNATNSNVDNSNVANNNVTNNNNIHGSYSGEYSGTHYNGARYSGESYASGHSGVDGASSVGTHHSTTHSTHSGAPHKGASHNAGTNAGSSAASANGGVGGHVSYRV